MTDEITETTRPTKADKAAAKARAKAERPWYKKKRIIIPLGVGLLIGAVALSGGGEQGAQQIEEAVQSEGAEDRPDEPTPGRADQQKEDQEVAIGETARVAGYEATVTSAEFQPELNDFETDGYIVANVRIVNTDDKAQPYNYFDWRVQTPNGQVIDPTFSTIDGQLDSGDLVQGGNVTGKVVFEVGETKGDFFLIYKPNAFDAARGLWKVTVS